LLLAVFVSPYTDSTAPVVDSLLVIIYFPLIIALGAGISLTGRTKKICDFSGAISYPLYMTHYPFLWIFLSYMETNQPTTALLAVIIPVAVVALILFSYLIMILLDIPVRAYLKNKWSGVK